MAATWAVLWQTRAGDIVVLKTDPPLIGLVIGPASRFKRATVVHWLQDLFPEAVEAASLVTSPVRARCVQALTRLRDRELGKADGIVTIGRNMQSRLQAATRGGARCVIIPNAADGEVIKPVPLQRSRRLTVGYCGTLGRMHDVETLHRAIDATTSPDRGIDWRFVGSGVGMTLLRQALAEHAPPSVSFAPSRPSSQVSQMLGEMDVHIVSLRAEADGISLPSKLYGILAAGRPVVFIGPPESEIAQLIASHDLGVAIDNGDADALVAALTAFADDRERIVRQGRNGRALFEKTYDRETVTASWIDLLHEMADREPAPAKPEPSADYKPGALASSASRIVRRYCP